jgi:hypothetical protein
MRGLCRAAVRPQSAVEACVPMSDLSHYHTRSISLRSTEIEATVEVIS